MKSVVKNKTSWYVGGLHFECVRCGTCCSGPGEGFIWVSSPEIKFIVDFLKISEEQLRQKYLKRVGLRTTIIEKPITRNCIFLQKVGDEKRCMIYPVRPNQCRAWPFWTENLTSPDAWNEAVKKCPGINSDGYYSFEEIEEIRKRKQWWLNGK